VCRHPHKKAQKCAEKYGSITGLYFGHQQVIFLNDWAAVKEALIKQNDNFYARFLSPVTQCFSGGLGMIKFETSLQFCDWQIIRI